MLLCVHIALCGLMVLVVNVEEEYKHRLLFQSVSFLSSESEEQESVNEWNVLWYIYTVEFYAAERKKELLPFATAWMGLESIMLSKISQAVKAKYHMISPLTGI